MEPILSILICSLESRSESFNRLLNKLQKQSENLPVEILYDIDNGEITIGSKRNKLIKKSQGEYVCFIDDDDDIDDNYISLILRALETKPDCVGIAGKIRLNNTENTFQHSLKYQGWYSINNQHYRSPGHLNPIKRSIALTVSFPEKSYGEDRVFMTNIREKLKIEVNIDKPIYFYTPSKQDIRKIRKIVRDIAIKEYFDRMK